PTPTPTSQQGTILTFGVQDDATIQSASPDANAGSATSLVVDNSPQQNILIKFQVDGLAGRTVTRATLKLYNVSSSNVGGNFYRVNDQSWEEDTVTWNNAPAHDNTLVASLGAVTSGNWYTLDLTSLITADGTYSLRVNSTSSDGADYRSKEGVNPPVLEVEVAGDATQTPTFTPTPTDTPTPTPTPTPTDTPTPTPTATSTPPVTGITYTYDGDGNMVKSEINGVVTYYVGKHYEKQIDGVTEKEIKYYTAGSNRLAMRENSTLTWLLSDHLGSTSVTADASGNLLSTLRYTAFGEVRAASGTTGTDYRYTGQREESELGLYYYVARWYDAYLNHWTQPDTIVPDPYNPQDWNRYSYGLNNPVKYNDPTGHTVSCDYGDECKHLAPSPKTILTAEYYVRYLKATGITINGNIRVEDARTFFNAFHKMNAALHWKFKEFVGSVTYNFKYVSDGHYGGVWQGNNTINFKSTSAG
ncbi:RHS repeat-associated core domain-containing protein, partial [bacterium]|nr:RHS repeat-associated core domain-containing protein [bacterium]